MGYTIFALTSLLLLFARTATTINNGLARTPQQGWNTWNALACAVDEELLIQTSAKLVSTGLRDAGYNYVVLDDCWSDGRGSDGYLRVDEKKFPHGMSWVADQIHDQGLLFGMYSSAGEMTCARYEGSLDWEKQDATSFAKWGSDYLKLDNCYHMARFGTPGASFDRYKAMGDALNATGRPILYSLCNWGEDYVHTWGMSIANSWRISGDIYDSFSRPDDLCACTEASDPHCVAPGSHCSVLNIINKVAPYVDRGQPGGWNDLDMLEVGQGGMTDDEYIAHFSMWAALKSPLILGNDLREMGAKSLSIVNNPAVIAVNQDPLGSSVRRIRRNFDVPKDEYGIGETHIWSGALFGGDQVVILLNAADEELEMSVSMEDIFVMEGPAGSAPHLQEKWEMYDLWANRMDEKTAQRILDTPAEKLESVFEEINWYNSTALPYKEGLKQRDERLMGKKIGPVPATGIKATVPRHGVKMYRLRSLGGGTGKRYNIVKDEL